MLEKLKEYCEKELLWMKRAKNLTEKREFLTRAYGATMLVLNCTDEYNEEIENWWSEEMLPKFRKELI